MVVVKATEHKVSIYSSPNLKKWTHLQRLRPGRRGRWGMGMPRPVPAGRGRQPTQRQMGDGRQPQPGRHRRRIRRPVLRRRLRRHHLHLRRPATYTPPTGTVLQDFESPPSPPGPPPAPPSATDRGRRATDRGVSGYLGEQLANSFHGGDGTGGTLTSPEFTVSQTYLNFLVGGGNHPHVPGTQLNSPPEGTVLFADFEVPDDTNLGDRLDATGDFLPDATRRHPAVRAAIGPSAAIPGKAAHWATTTPARSAHPLHHHRNYRPCWAAAAN